MLTSLQKAKDQGAKIIAVNPLPEVSLMHVTNPNPQDYPKPLELNVALLGHGQALANLYLPLRVNGDVAAIKGILKELFESRRGGRRQLTRSLSRPTPRASKRCGRTWRRRVGTRSSRRAGRLRHSRYQCAVLDPWSTDRAESRGVTSPFSMSARSTMIETSTRKCARFQ